MTLAVFSKWELTITSLEMRMMTIMKKGEITAAISLYKNAVDDLVRRSDAEFCLERSSRGFDAGMPTNNEGK